MQSVLWFQKYRNACRCTGYKQLVDAVMDAAQVINGKKTMGDLTFKMPADGRIWGTRYPRPTALAKVTCTCDFGADLGKKSRRKHCSWPWSRPGYQGCRLGKTRSKAFSVSVCFPWFRRNPTVWANFTASFGPAAICGHLTHMCRTGSLKLGYGLFVATKYH